MSARRKAAKHRTSVDSVKARVARGEKALKALELSCVTSAGYGRIARVWSALWALDQEQAQLKIGIEELIEVYEERGGSRDTFFAELRKLVRPTELRKSAIDDRRITAHHVPAVVERLPTRALIGPERSAVAKRRSKS